MTDYKVALEVYNGPMDLLLFLIKREEIDIHDIPIARITSQYLAYVDLLRELDPEVVSEFVVLAATLMEIKSRVLLPRPPVEEVEEEMVDPRLELVRQLLEYKKFKDAAHSLDAAAEERALKFARRPVRPEQPEDEVELENIEIWDLFDAFNRLLEQTGKAQAVHRVQVDDTPIALHEEDILDSIGRAGGAQPFEEIFAGRGRGEMIGLFLALLELVRRQQVRVSQDCPFGRILIHLRDPDDPNGEAAQNLSDESADLDSAEASSESQDSAPAAPDASDEDDPTPPLRDVESRPPFDDRPEHEQTSLPLTLVGEVRAPDCEQMPLEGNEQHSTEQLSGPVPSAGGFSVDEQTSSPVPFVDGNEHPGIGAEQ